MSGFARKKPFVQSIGNANRKQVADAIQLNGKALPCHVTAVNGQIVTVAFDVTSPFTLPSIAVPIFGSEYARAPTQVNDKGVVYPCDVRIGNVSGLGGAAPPDIAQPGNLSALVFFPIGNANWQPTDAGVYTLYGPDGVTIMLQDRTIRLDLTRNGIAITLDGGRVNIIGGEVNVFDSNVNVSGADVLADGISLKHHIHSGVTTGGGETGEPVPS